MPFISSKDAPRKCFHPFTGLLNSTGFRTDLKISVSFQSDPQFGSQTWEYFSTLCLSAETWPLCKKSIKTHITGTPNRSACIIRASILLAILFHLTPARPPFCFWPELLHTKCLLSFSASFKTWSFECPLHVIYIFNPFLIPPHLTSCPSKSRV